MKPGQYIRKHRQAAQISLRGLASLLGVSHVFLGALERGKKPVPPTMVERLEEHVPGIKASALRRYILDAVPLTFEFAPDDSEGRLLALAFARKAQDGFSPEEIERLRAILFDDEEEDEDE